MPPAPPAASGSTSPFTRLAGWIVRNHRVVVLAFVLASVAAGVYAASVASQLRSAGLEAPASESNRVGEVLCERLGVGQPDVVAILHTPGSSVRDSGFATLVLDALELLHEDEGVATALSYYNTGLESLVSLDGERTVMVIDLAGSAADAIETLARIEPILKEIDAEVEIGPTDSSDTSPGAWLWPPWPGQRYSRPFAGLHPLLPPPLPAWLCLKWTGITTIRNSPPGSWQPSGPLASSSHPV